ncbi:MAG: TlpA family protein disulfide reductase [Thermanaerothrix sp.]|nr:TlpA family protein disulfide reductase [Thermanaerothrix sp.]
MHGLQKSWNFIGVILVLFSLLWLGFSTYWFPPHNDQYVAPQIGFTAPQFALSTLDGETLDLAQIQTQVIILNFWATWCPPCRAEMPTFEHLSREFEPDQVLFIGVNATFQDDFSDIHQFAKENNITFPIVLDLDGKVSRAYQIQAFPTTFLLARDKSIRNMMIGGPVPAAWLRSEIEQILNH